MSEASNFERLAAINVGAHIEKKNGLSYLSWAWAVDQLLRADPGASWEYGEPRMYGETMMVYCTVTAFGTARTMQLPVMDHRNKAIANPDAFAVNTAMQRALVKAIALHGLGLYIYAGEDVPLGDAASESGERSAAEEKALQAMRDAAMAGTERLRKAWADAQPDMRRALAGELASLKQAAAAADAESADERSAIEAA